MSTGTEGPPPAEAEGASGGETAAMVPALVRPARAAEVAELARLRYRMRAELGGADEAEEPFVARCAAWMAPRLAASTAWRCWVAEDRGCLVGNLWLQRLEKLPNPGGDPEQHAYVTNVFVVPAARGRGVASRLLSEALAWCRDHAVDAVLLRASPRSRSLYLRHGFAVRDDLFELRPASGRR